MQYLTRKSIIKCSHGGTVEPNSADRLLEINGKTVLTFEDINGAAINGCPQSGPGVSPCTVVQRILNGKSTSLKVGGAIPLLDNLQALTNGIPPGTCSVEDPGDSILWNANRASSQASAHAADPNNPPQEARSKSPLSRGVTFHLKIADEFRQLAEEMGPVPVRIVAVQKGKRHRYFRTLVDPAAGAQFLLPLSPTEPFWYIIRTFPFDSNAVEWFAQSGQEHHFVTIPKDLMPGRRARGESAQRRQATLRGILSASKASPKPNVATLALANFLDPRTRQLPPWQIVTIPQHFDPSASASKDEFNKPLASITLAPVYPRLLKLKSAASQLQKSLEALSPRVINRPRFDRVQLALFCRQLSGLQNLKNIGDFATYSNLSRAGREGSVRMPPPDTQTIYELFLQTFSKTLEPSIRDLPRDLDRVVERIDDVKLLDERDRFCAGTPRYPLSKDDIPPKVDIPPKPGAKDPSPAWLRRILSMPSPAENAAKPIPAHDSRTQPSIANNRPPSKIEQARTQAATKGGTPAQLDRQKELCAHLLIAFENEADTDIRHALELIQGAADLLQLFSNAERDGSQLQSDIKNTIDNALKRQAAFIDEFAIPRLNAEKPSSPLPSREVLLFLARSLEAVTEKFIDGWTKHVVVLSKIQLQIQRTVTIVSVVTKEFTLVAALRRQLTEIFVDTRHIESPARPGLLRLRVMFLPLFAIDAIEKVTRNRSQWTVDDYLEITNAFHQLAASLAGISKSAIENELVKLLKEAPNSFYSATGVKAAQAELLAISGRRLVNGLIVVGATLNVGEAVVDYADGNSLRAAVLLSSAALKVSAVATSPTLVGAIVLFLASILLDLAAVVLTRDEWEKKLNSILKESEFGGVGIRKLGMQIPEGGFKSWSDDEVSLRHLNLSGTQTSETLGALRKARAELRWTFKTGWVEVETAVQASRDSPPDRFSPLDLSLDGRTRTTRRIQATFTEGILFELNPGWNAEHVESTAFEWEWILEGVLLYRGTLSVCVGPSRESANPKAVIELNSIEPKTDGGDNLLIKGEFGVSSLPPRVVSYDATAVAYCDRRPHRRTIELNAQPDRPLRIVLAFNAHGPNREYHVDTVEESPGKLSLLPMLKIPSFNVSVLKDDLSMVAGPPGGLGALRISMIQAKWPSSYDAVSLEPSRKHFWATNVSGGQPFVSNWPPGI